MKCCICEKTIKGYGNNPDPICSIDDNESRCCDLCNEFVIKARLLKINSADSEPKVGDTLVIFWSKNSTKPTEFIKNNGKFIAGEVTEIKENNIVKEYIGTWGNYTILNTDSFSIVR